MKKTLLFIASFFTLFDLTGCEQTVFGVPKDQWNQLSPQQQSQIIEGYNQRQQTETQKASSSTSVNFPKF